MIPEAFMGDATLYPPPAEQLDATATCRCGWSGTKFVWPTMARVGTGDRRVETPIGHERATCPDCGEHLDPRRRHPCWPGP